MLNSYRHTHRQEVQNQLVVILNANLIVWPQKFPTTCRVLSSLHLHWFFFIIRATSAACLAASSSFDSRTELVVHVEVTCHGHWQQQLGHRWLEVPDRCSSRGIQIQQWGSPPQLEDDDSIRPWSPKADGAYVCLTSTTTCTVSCS